jgi:transposase
MITILFLLKKILKSISSKVKSLISEVVIDMCDFYKKAVEEALPSAKIVVDHFHIIQDANRRIDQERFILQDINKKKIPRYILNYWNNKSTNGFMEGMHNKMKLIKIISFKNKKVFIYKIMLSVLITTLLFNKI